MATVGQKPELVFFDKLAKANSTIERFLGTDYLLGTDDLLVEEDGQRVDENLVEARVMEVEQLLELTLDGVRPLEFVRTPPSKVRGAGKWVLFDEKSNQEVEEAGDEEDHCKNDYDEEDCRANPTAWRSWSWGGRGL